MKRVIKLDPSQADIVVTALRYANNNLTEETAKKETQDAIDVVLDIIYSIPELIQDTTNPVEFILDEPVICTIFASLVFTVEIDNSLTPTIAAEHYKIANRIWTAKIWTPKGY